MDPRRSPENTPPPSLRSELFVDALCGAPDTLAKFNVLGDQGLLKYEGTAWVVDREQLSKWTMDKLMDLYSQLKAEEVRRARGY